MRVIHSQLTGDFITDIILKYYVQFRQTNNSFHSTTMGHIALCAPLLLTLQLRSSKLPPKHLQMQIGTGLTAYCRDRQDRIEKLMRGITIKNYPSLSLPVDRMKH